MTIKDCIDIVDNIKPNQYTIKDKVMWLSFIEEIIINDVLKTHEGYDGRYDNFEGYTEDKLSVTLIVPSPYDRLYTAYLKMKIDQENGETARYNNSMALYNTYMLEFRKHYNKTHMPLDTIGKRDMMPPKKATVGLTDAEYENLKRDILADLSEDVAQQTSDDKIQAVVTSYMNTNAEMLKGKDGEDGLDGIDGMPCTHSWNGTKLTINSASGTTTVDLKGDEGEPGKDGYTPQKGIDYVDGRTPIKGIDYFDGKDGRDGEDGKDGLTPVKGVDYHDGYTPIRGVDYWTDSDKAEVIAEASASVEDIVDNRFSEIKVDVVNKLDEQDAIISTKADKEYVDSVKADMEAVFEQEFAEVNTGINTELSKKADRDYVDAKDVMMVSYADQKADEAETEAKAYTDSMKETIDEELVKKASIAYVDEKDTEAKSEAVIEAKEYTDTKAADAIAESKEYTDAAKDEVLKTVSESANALKETASGAMVGIDDVSPTSHNVKVKVKSKNLIPYPFSTDISTRNGITFTSNDDQTITLNGTPTANTSFSVVSASAPVIAKAEKGKTYTISHSGAFPNSSYISLSILNSNGAPVQYVRSSNSGTTFVSPVDGRFTLAFVIVSGAAFENITFAVQLEEGDTATEFAKYVDPTTAVLTRCKKNLMPYPYYQNRTSFNGLTITYNDGTAHFKGTATANVVYVLAATSDASARVPIKAGTYTLSGNPSSYAMTAFIYADNTTTSYTKSVQAANGNKGNITLEADGYFGCYIVIPSGETVDFTLSPQLELGTEATEYQAYSKESFELSENALYEIASISPMMTFLTDKANTIVEVEYNQDVNAFKENMENTIAQLKQAIIELGGTV